METQSDVASWAAALANPVSAKWRPFRSYAEIGGALAAVARMPGVHVVRSGSSVRGEPIWRVVVDAAADQAPTLLVVAGLHAMEHVGVFAALALIEQAARRVAPWPLVRLAVLPLVNPDGFRAVEGDLARGRRRFRRRNANGVDLNRNFAGSFRRRYWVHALAPMFFRPGNAPLSEPESMAVDETCSLLGPAIAVSLHAFGDRIYLPWAGAGDAPADAGDLRDLARTAAGAAGRFKRITQLGSHRVIAPGAEIDCFYGRHNALAMLFEIGTGPRWREPGSWFLPYAWYTASGQRLAGDIDATVAAIAAVVPHAHGAEARRTLIR
ncbi:MAG TPA: M14 family metallopeptidase [Kofleriaceae bacterium]|nr:M14 family metallopeptidase [Kofleriaceae bacterium]